jgi:hypothetical protein
MNSYLSLTTEDRNIYCRQASEKLDYPLPAAVIEKDFWVCWILKLLIDLPAINGNITFKGGTSLSKAWGLIDRFSEDIDIAINRKVFGQQPPHGPEDAASNMQRKKKIVELQKSSTDYIINFIKPTLENKIKSILGLEKFDLRIIRIGNEINLEFEYPGTLKSELAGLLPVVLIEIVSRADDVPNQNKLITPFIFTAFPELSQEASFQVSTLLPERTFLEKLLFLNETIGGFNKGSERKSRHFYDLWKLYHAGIFDTLKNKPELLKIVVEHRQTFYRYNKLNYDGILKNGVEICISEDALSEWRSDYNQTSAMIYKDRPSFDDLVKFAKLIQIEFNTWVNSIQQING